MIILHVITHLGQGGAEAALVRLVTSPANRASNMVVSMREEGYHGPALRAAGIPLHTLGFIRGRLSLNGVLKLHRIIRKERPDIVQTWMYHSNLVGGVVARFSGIRRVVWGIRFSGFDGGNTSFSTRIVARLCAFLSRMVPSAIVFCSTRAIRIHKAMGYRIRRSLAIPNGYDLSVFSPDPSGRERLRREWGIQDKEILLGMVARWDPQKDHANLLRALASLKSGGLRFRCVLVGSGMSPENSLLHDEIRSNVLEDRIVLAGARDDIPCVMSAIDVHVLSSKYGEAFPNVVAEAMACGTPCVVTDVGDAAQIVGDLGWVAPPNNPEELASCIGKAFEALSSPGIDDLKRSCRERIRERFSLETMVDRYRRLWVSLMKGTNS